MTPEVRVATTPWLDIAYEPHGPEDGDAVVLAHGFPYDPRCFDAVVPPLVAKGRRVVVPYLRGFGPTRFRSDWTMRSGQQAAIASDLIELIEALAIPRAVLMGFDWGGRAAAIAAALRPDRVRGLVTGGGYHIQDIARLSGVLPPEVEHRLWYQTYFNTTRGRAGLETDRVAFCELLWRLWSPTWGFTPETYQASAASFDNPDFVAIVIHSYRHRCGAAPGDPVFDAIERKLAEAPPIDRPTISLLGADDGVSPPSAEDHDAARFIAAPTSAESCRGSGTTSRGKRYGRHRGRHSRACWIGPERRDQLALQSEWSSSGPPRDAADHGGLDQVGGPEVGDRADDQVAQPGQGAAVGLVDRGEEPADRLVEPHMRAAQAGVENKRIGNVGGAAQCNRQGVGVQQGHVGALAQLRAGRMPGVADVGQRRFGGSLQGAVGVAREGELVGARDLVQQRRGLGPERQGVGLPALKPVGGPGVQPVGAQAPEVGGLRTGAPGDLADRQHPGHDAGGAVALLQGARVEGRGCSSGQSRLAHSAP